MEKSLINRAWIFLFFLSSVFLFSCKNVKNISKNQNYTEFNKIVANRVVSLSPSSTELLCLAGAKEKIVARTDFCDFPEDVKIIPSVGGFDGKSISIEKILSFSPDLVCLTKGMHEHFIQILTDQKINFYVSQNDSISSILNDTKNFGKICGTSKIAEENVQKIEKNLEIIKEKTKNLKKVSVYWEIWDSPLMSCGSLSNVNELIEIAGGKNIFSEINEAYPIVSEESLIYKNPEIIIFSKDFVGGVQKIKNRSGWKNISAVKNDKIFAVDSNTLTRPGSRIVENIETLLKIFHPEV